MKQLQKIFFQNEPSHEEKEAKVGFGNNPNSPFSKFIGNSKAIFKLQTAAFAALGRPNHLMRDLNFAILGPSSAGKTTLARIYADTVELPFIEISPKSIITLKSLFKKVREVLANEGIPLIEEIANHYVLPPLVIFIDEVHALATNMIQGLLKPIEYDDTSMVLENGITVNTYNVTWIIATTDVGKLDDAFRNRFTEINLEYLNKKDVAKIVKLAHPDIPDNICELISHYNSRVPRKALEFARFVKMAKKMTQKDWEETTNQMAENEGIDKHGMSRVHLKVLKAIGERPVAKNRIGIIAGVKNQEAEKYIMPWMLSSTDDQPALVCVTDEGYCLTEYGQEQLKLRKEEKNDNR